MNPTRLIGLRFLLKGMSFINVVVSEQEGRRIVAGFISGKLEDVIGNATGFPGIAGTIWSIRTSEIQAVHQFDWEQVMQNSPQSKSPAVPFNPFGKSGQN